MRSCRCFFAADSYRHSRRSQANKSFFLLDFTSIKILFFYCYYHKSTVCSPHPFFWATLLPAPQTQNLSLLPESLRCRLASARHLPGHGKRPQRTGLPPIPLPPKVPLRPGASGGWETTPFRLAERSAEASDAFFAMKILVTGKGGREHALLTALAESPSQPQLFCWPGSDAIFEIARRTTARDLPSLIGFMLEEAIDLCVAGEESLLVTDQGLANLCRGRRHPLLGPAEGIRPAGSQQGIRQAIPRAPRHPDGCLYRGGHHGRGASPR